MRQRADRLISDDAHVIENFLELTGRRRALLRREVRFAAQINGIESKGEGRIRLSEFIGRRRRKRVDGLFAVTAVKCDRSANHWDKIELYDGVFAKTFPQIGG